MKILKLGVDEGAVVEIENTLSACQAMVGGYIEALPIDGRWLHDPCCMVLNEEGKLKNLPDNPAATAIYRIATGAHDRIAGDAFIVGINGDDFCDVLDSVVQRCSAIAKAAYEEAKRRAGD